MRSDANPVNRAGAVSPTISKLEPFRASDISNGIYADEVDQLGRVWYHIPNLGPKFCDAVRKYSIIANFKEAHVIARKRSKESECMWVGIVGDPATYTTGSKRHLIEFMMRNPGLNIDQSGRRQHTRIRTNKASNPLKKRRKKRRRMPFTSSRSDSSDVSSANDTQSKHRSRNLGADKGVTPDDLNVMSESDEESSAMSTTPSVLSIERQESGQYGFSVRDMTSASPPPPNEPRQKQSLFTLPHPSSYSSQPRSDWFDSVLRDPTLFALREPPMPSPESAKTCTLSRLSFNYPPHPASPVVPSVPRKYSVEDLNELLVKSDVI